MNILKQILVVGSGDQRNPKTWSGTSRHLIDCFENKRIDVSDCNIMDSVTPFKKLLIKIYNKLAYYRISARSPFLINSCSKYIERRITQTKIEHVLFISENVEVKNPHVNVSIYVDAVLRPLNQFGSNVKYTQRPGYERFLRIFERNDIKSCKRANQIFTQNEWTRQYLIKGYGIDEKKITNVGFGVNIKPLCEDKQYDKNLLLIVIRKGTEKYKGLYLLLEAFRIVRNKGLDIKLAVVGTDGPKEEGVTYYYNQPRSVTVELFKRCTLYVMPALSEPNGITYLEGLANKAPIIGLNRYSFPEFSGYGKYGFICNNEDPEELAGIIEKALSDKQLLKKMGEGGQKYVIEHYSWEKVADKMIEVIENNNN